MLNELRGGNNDGNEPGEDIQDHLHEPRNDIVNFESIEPIRQIAMEENDNIRYANTPASGVGFLIPAWAKKHIKNIKFNPVRPRHATLKCEIKGVKICFFTIYAPHQTLDPQGVITEVIMNELGALAIQAEGEGYMCIMAGDTNTDLGAPKRA